MLDEPHGFGEEAWQAYVKVVEGKYWSSCGEMLFLVECAGRDAIVAKRIDE